MQLPDEAISYNYQSLLIPQQRGGGTAAAELRAKHFLNLNRIKDLARRVEQAKKPGGHRTSGKFAPFPPSSCQVNSAFIDLPQNLLDGLQSQAGRQRSWPHPQLRRRTMRRTGRLHQSFSAKAVKGLGGRVLFEALEEQEYHNGTTRRIASGRAATVLCRRQVSTTIRCRICTICWRVTCVDPDKREERWAVVAISKSGMTWRRRRHCAGYSVAMRRNTMACVPTG